MNRVLAYVGLGSNLDDPLRQLDVAMAALDAIADTRVVRQSRRYRTAPWGLSAQPDFINAVAELDTALNAQALLGELLKIEQQLGRRRDGQQWGPRVIDLDLLLHGDLSIDSADLVLPHPRMAERSFVLVPLAELAPELRITGGASVAERLAMLDTSGCARL